MAHKQKPIRYLGAITGVGVLSLEGETIARATYDFDGYSGERFGVACSGEIRFSESELACAADQRSLQLLTQDGRRLDLKLSEKQKFPANGVAHVEVTGDLPADLSDWRQRSAA